jgi:hypothetical protein
MCKTDVDDKPNPAPFNINPAFYALKVPSPLISSFKIHDHARVAIVADKLLKKGANPNGTRIRHTKYTEYLFFILIIILIYIYRIS